MTTPPAATVELMPCPFCGDLPSIVQFGQDGDGYWLVMCDGDDGRMQPSPEGLRRHRHCDAAPEVEGATEAEAIAAWNTRAPAITQTFEAGPYKIYSRVPGEKLRVSEIDTIGSHFGNGGTFDPEAKASQPLKDAVRIYRESQKLETVEAPPKASSQD